MCEAAYEKKAEDILIMDMKQRALFCDNFVIMSAPSAVRVKTIVEFIESSMESAGWRAKHKEGLAEAFWVLLDYEDVVVHVFYHETRKYYGLEHLWGDAPRRLYLSHPNKDKAPK